MTLNPKFIPNSLAERLESIVSNMASKRKAEGLPEIEPVGEDIPNSLAGLDTEIAQRFGLLPLPKEELNRIDAETMRLHRQAARELEESNRIAAFHRICPEEFRKPFDWTLAPADVSRPEVAKVFGWKFGSKGLFVYGETGRVKSRAVYVLIKRLYEKENRKIMVFDGPGFSNLCTRAFGDPEHTEEIFEPLMSCDVLFIDDFAKRLTPATIEGAFMVTDRRTARALPMLVTINYSADDLLKMESTKSAGVQAASVMGPLIRRFKDYCHPVVL